VGKVIGSGGAVIKELQAKSGARIQIEQDFPPDQPRKINITGFCFFLAVDLFFLMSYMNFGISKELPLRLMLRCRWFRAFLLATL
jgi:hypothetical protein